MCSEIVNMYFKLSLKIVNFDDCLMKTKYKFFLSPGSMLDIINTMLPSSSLVAT
jgi:hypothetical protein